MANTLTDVKPKILARGLSRLRKRLVMPNIVNRDFSADAAKRGATIDVPIPPTVATRAVTPGVTPTAAPAITEETVKIELDQWHEAPIAFTDKDRLETLDEAVMMAVDAAADALAEKVNASLFALYPAVYNYVGTAGTTPFGSDYKLATEARKILNKNKALLPNRFMVVDPDAEQKAIELSAFADASFTKRDGVIIEGDIGRKVGYDWMMDQQVPTHTAGTITTGLIAKAATAVAAGLKTFVATTAASTGACALLAGDVIDIAGHTTTYVLTAAATQASAASDVTLAFEPGLEKALVGSEAITVKASHVVNLALHRDAFAIAVRPFLKPSSAAEVLTMVDPATKLPLRLEISRQNKQDYWSFDLLWGVKAVRPELAVRVAG